MFIDSLGIKFAADYGTVGTQAAISAAISAIGSDSRTLYLCPGTWSITSDLTIPTNITLRPERGAILSIATGITLTINGSLDAGPYQIYSWSGTGKVVYGDSSTVKEFLPEHWGGKGDGSTTDTAALQAALTCAANSTAALIRLRDYATYMTGALTTTGTTAKSIKILGKATIKQIATQNSTDFFRLSTWGEVVLDGPTFNFDVANQSNAGVRFTEAANYATRNGCNVTVDNCTKFVARNCTFINGYNCDLIAYNNGSNEIEDNHFSVATADIYTLIVESGSNLIASRNILVGMDWATAGTYAGASSHFLIWRVNDFNVSNNKMKGIQFIAIGVPTTGNNRAILSNNIIDYPIADTSIQAYIDVTVTGNVIRKSGDWGISVDESTKFVVSNNVIDGTQVAGINAQNFRGGIITGNLVIDIAQDYAEIHALRAPSASTSDGIRVRNNSAQFYELMVTNNVLTFDTLPTPANLGTAININVATIGTETNIVSGNVCRVDNTNLPTWIVSAPTHLVYIGTVTGTFTFGEIVTGGTSGATAIMSGATSARMWLSYMTGQFRNGETITGGTSGATAVVAAAAAQQTINTGTVAYGNRDRFSQSFDVPSIRSGKITLTANVTSTNVYSSNVSATSKLVLFPRTANAAAELGAGTCYTWATAAGGFTIIHANSAQTDRTFDYIVVD